MAHKCYITSQVLFKNPDFLWFILVCSFCMYNYVSTIQMVNCLCVTFIYLRKAAEAMQISSQLKKKLLLYTCALHLLRHVYQFRSISSPSSNKYQCARDFCVCIYLFFIEWFQFICFCFSLSLTDSFLHSLSLPVLRWPFCFSLLYELCAFIKDFLSKAWFS